MILLEDVEAALPSFVEVKEAAMNNDLISINV